jgi:predicted DCC family thiol-disulfide oxidoreductase YuxK
MKRMNEPSDKIIVFYDGDCGFCQASLNFVRSYDYNRRLKFIPYQDPQNKINYPMIDLSYSDMGIQVLSPDGTITKDEAGFATCFVAMPGFWLLGKFIVFPLVRPFAKIVYKFIARNRTLMSKIFGTAECKL